MATYATAEQLAEYVADNGEVTLPGDADAIERLLQRAERRVDNVLGRYPDNADMGLKLDPESLEDGQSAALARATCASAEHELLVGLDYLAGAEDFLGAGLAPLRPPLRKSPRVLEELAGSGLLLYSGCAAPTPPDEEPAAA